MNLKIPLVLDTSHWEQIADWGKITPRPVLGITKATEGDFYQDDTFIRYWQGMKANNIPRTAYHFHRKNIPYYSQAKYFTDFVKSAGVTDADYFALDLEEGGETATQILAWIDAVEKIFPHNAILIYSRKNILDPIVMTEAQKGRLKRYPTWIAGYPNNPDLYKTIPSFYIPDQTKWGAPWLWQYTDKGSVSGVIGAVDCNWIDPVFLALIEEPVIQPPADTITQPYDGIKLIRGERYGCKIYVDIVDPEKIKRMEVRNSYDLPSNIAKGAGAYLAWNSDDWNRITLQPLDNNEPSLMIFPDRLLSIGNNHNTIGYTYHSSGLRYLVQAGVNKIPVDGTEAKYTERHARSVTGLSTDGVLIHLTVDGDYPDKGVLLWEAAEIMRSFGASTAFDQGGGGDSVEVVSGAVVNVPDDDTNGVHHERKVPQTILCFVDNGGSMPTTNGTAKEILGNTTTVRNKPSRYGVGQYSLPPGNTTSFVEIVPALPATSTTPLDNVNDQWLKLPDGNYINYILYSPAAKNYYSVLTYPADPAPTESPVKSSDLHIENASKMARLTILRLDGTVENKDYPTA